MIRSARAAAIGATAAAGVLVAWLAPSVVGNQHPPRTQTQLLAGALASSGHLDSAAVTAALHGLATPPLPAADTPSCADPLTPPAAQFPNGSQGLGIPFVAALSGGELLSGYHADWVGPSTKQYRHPTYPWSLTLTGISGWVTGLLEVPSLQAKVDPATGVAFCDDRDLTFVRPDHQPCGPTGPCNTLPRPPRLQFTLVADTKSYDSTQNFNPGIHGVSKFGNFAAEFFSVNVDAPPLLAVKGVDANGALELGGQTSVTAKVASWYNTASGNKLSHYALQGGCTSFPGKTVINVGTQPQAEPVGGPPGASPQFVPHPLVGGFPHAGNATPATATLASTAFPVAAFNDAPGLTPNCGFGITLNGGLSGWGPSPGPGQPGVVNDICIPTSTSGAPCPQIASPPGWSQFTVNATIASLGLPYSNSVPSGFGFTP